MLGAFKASTAESMVDFAGTFDLTLMFNKRQYKTHLKSQHRKRLSMDASWEFWNNRIFDTWHLVENLFFIKEFRGIDALGATFAELLLLIQCIPNDEQRLKLLKSI